MNRILVGDAFTVLRGLPDQSTHCCVTSPPYWCLRDYGVDGQMGLEKTPEEFVQRMVYVFRQVHRVLKDDGTLWVNMGDSYFSAGGSGWQGKTAARENRRHTQRSLQSRAARAVRESGSGIKPKDLVGMPWMLALALRQDGWYLRRDIIWHKRNPMPESVRDRPTTSHEYIFLLSKRAKGYYYDAEAIKEPCSPDTHARYARGRSGNHKHADGGPGGQTIARSFSHMRKPGVAPKAVEGTGIIRANQSFQAATAHIVDRRNKRSVWTLSNTGFKDAHFATFPPKLIEPCVLAGCPPGGTVLDPFFGAGTTGLVALQHGRQYLGIELNPAYAEIAEKRLAKAAPVQQELLR